MKLHLLLQLLFETVSPIRPGTKLLEEAEEALELPTRTSQVLGRITGGHHHAVHEALGSNPGLVDARGTLPTEPHSQPLRLFIDNLTLVLW